MADGSKPINGEPMEQPPEPSDPEPSSVEGHKVGPGHPPKQHTWKKGIPSPNPKGRPRKKPSMEPDLKQALEEALNAKVTLTKDAKRRTLTKAKLGIEQLVNQFAKGDRYARRDLMDYAQQLGVDLLAGGRKAIEEALAPEHQAVLDAYISRRTGARNATVADRVIAPPELLDDDVTKPKPKPRAPTPMTSNAPPARPASTSTPNPAAHSITQSSTTSASSQPVPAQEARMSNVAAQSPSWLESMHTESNTSASGAGMAEAQPDILTPTSPLLTETVPPESTPTATELETMQLPPKPERPPGPTTRKYIRELRAWELEVRRIQQLSTETSVNTSPEDDQ